MKRYLLLSLWLLPLGLLAQPKCPVPKARKPGGRLYATAWIMPNARLLPVAGQQASGGMFNTYLPPVADGVSVARSWRADLCAGSGMGWWLQRNVAVQAGGSLSLATVDLRNTQSEGAYMQGLYVGLPLHLYYYPNLPVAQFREVNSLTVGLIPVYALGVNSNFPAPKGFQSLHAEVAMGFSRKPGPHWEVRCETVFSYPLIGNVWYQTALVGFRMGILRRSRTI